MNAGERKTSLGAKTGPRLGTPIRKMLRRIRRRRLGLILLNREPIHGRGIECFALFHNGTNPNTMVSTSQTIYERGIPLLDDNTDARSLLAQCNSFLLRRQNTPDLSERRANLVGQGLERGLNVGRKRGSRALQTASTTRLQRIANEENAPGLFRVRR